MSNLIKVPHTVVFEAIIDLEKIPAHLLPALISLSEKDLHEMCLGATLNAIQSTEMLIKANENNSWAEVKLA
jgi:hypothetical protein